jgi:endonuclease/exonuclease/phosphatase family metal-dependent hydrolase
MFSVMTLSLGSDSPKHGPWRVRKRLIAKAVESRRPDVVALQAVKRQPDLDQIADLSALLPGYPHASSEGSSAFLSQNALEETGSLRFSRIPDGDDKNPRHLVRARLGGVWLFNVDLSWSPEQARQNLAETVEGLARFPGDGILLGCFGRAAALEALKAKGWVDAWQKLRPGDPGFTFESDKPALRADYIWVDAALAPRLKKIETLTLETADGFARLSDHLALAAVLD